MSATAHTDTEGPHVNPHAAPQGRRLRPATVDGIQRAIRAGVPYSAIARVYGVAPATVMRLSKTVTREMEADLDALSELAPLEEELRGVIEDDRMLEDALRLVRAGWLLHKSRGRSR